MFFILGLNHICTACLVQQQNACLKTFSDRHYRLNRFKTFG
ncbi:hypothetical protein HMPREF9370_1155 [Neisseria wadsworthii 9715]|uniref:Uncharacterized protein n=1 Tax=Neisseria wadsworthii 9715 TaxID=1030841 RepID=G4CPZ5_9NEIS|nr:hypothetical protein HMPREF9370_1155 [Neisseria wadsworthii 9715]